MSRRKKSAGTPVIIRYEGSGRADRAGWHLSDVVAIFPAEAGDVGDPRSMSCYSSTGQHSTCTAGYIGSKTKPATPAQKRAMLSERERSATRICASFLVRHRRTRRNVVGSFVRKGAG